MSKVKFTPESMPQSSEDLIQALRQTLEQATPLDDFVRVPSIAILADSTTPFCRVKVRRVR